MGDQEKLKFSSDTVISVKTESVVIPAPDSENACEDPFDNFEGFGPGHSDIDPLSDLGEVTSSNQETNQSNPINPGPPPPKKLKKIRPCICQKCNCGFPTAELYEKHLITAHKNDLSFACRHCSKRFSNRTNMERHESIHNAKRFSGPPKFQCDQCDKSYHLKGSLDSHRKKFHFGYKPPIKRTEKDPVIEHHSTKGTKNPTPFRKPKEIFSCPHCDLTFNMKCLLKNHMICHTKDKPFQCSQCQQQFPRKDSLSSHIRRIHQNPTPTRVTRPPPKWQYKQPWPCSVCGKVFQLPSKLRLHMTLHTGEKRHECEECGMRFRLSGDLRTHKVTHQPLDTTGLRTFKCRVCGKEGFRRFNEYMSHRTKRHAHIPFEGENERPFACGICGKPHYLRIQAIICTLLGHDPSSLQKTMFKHKCPECPAEVFGFHSQAVLRRHWDLEHKEKVLPVELRKGMYNENLKPEELPRGVKIDKDKSKQIWRDGPPPVKTEFPMFVELELLPIPEEEWFKKQVPSSGIRKKLTTPVVTQCPICGLILSKKSNWRRHMANVHNAERAPKILKSAIPSNDSSKLKISSEKLKCKVCDKQFGKLTTLRLHEKMHAKGNMIPGRGRGRPRKEVTTESRVGMEEPAKTFQNYVIKRRPGHPRKYQRVIKLEPEVPSAEPLLEDIPGNIVVKEEIPDQNGGDIEWKIAPPIASMFGCRFCSREFGKVRALRIHELRSHLGSSWSTSRKNDKKTRENLRPIISRVVSATIPSLEEESRVLDGPAEDPGIRSVSSARINVNDRDAIRNIIGYRKVQIKLIRLEEDDATLVEAFLSGINVD